MPRKKREISKPKKETHETQLSKKTITTMAKNGIGHKNLLSIINNLDKK